MFNVFIYLVFILVYLLSVFGCWGGDNFDLVFSIEDCA